MLLKQKEIKGRKKLDRREVGRRMGKDGARRSRASEEREIKDNVGYHLL